ncbi:MAG: hypothetical protein Q9159_001892 [Coniocarpon cinnabarinum]
MYRSHLCIAALAALSFTSIAIELDVNDTASIRAAAQNLTQGVLSYYENYNTSNGIQPWQVGLFPFLPYYWWESGAIWGGFIDYQVLTGDTTYQQDILNAIAAQVGPSYDFVVPEQANDDQAFWVLNAVAALEYDFPPLPCPSDGAQPCQTSWLTLADNAFNLFARRYVNDSATCNGGLKWQYTPTQSGYTYKNSISNGGFFNVAARLFRYTGNQTYGEWAQRAWDWETGVGFITPDFHVYDGAGDADGQNCTLIDPSQFSYNTAVWVMGAAAMAAANANGTGQAWTQRVEGFVEAASTEFFSPFPNATNVMFEQICEEAGTCNTDQLSFKAYLSRFLSKSALLVPSVQPNVTTLLQASAAAAAQSCSGLGNNTCGTKWYVDGWDGSIGLGQQLTALETVQSLLAPGGPKLGTAA